ncbi:MAG: sensor histidine kinase [Flexibacteraceae bacterium]
MKQTTNNIPKDIRNRLYRLALFTSPIIATYGIAPVVIFEKLDFPLSILVISGVSLNVFLFWVINIFLLEKLYHKPKIQLYVVSFLLVFATHIPKFWIDEIFPFPFQGIIEQFLVYPVITTIAVDVIIWIIINSTLLSEKSKLAEIRIEQLNTKNVEAQKQVLLQQLQPHFLFNALNTLKSIIPEDPELAENYTLELSNFLRYSMQAKDNELVSLADELKFSQDFINLQKVRFGGAIQYHIEIAQELLNKKIPVFALQTLVENALKHNSFSDTKVLVISIISEMDKIVVRNNRFPKKLQHPSGLGLQNLNERYRLVCNAQIEIVKNEDEFIVKLALI